MKLKNSKAPTLRKALLFSIIFLFLIIGSIFVYQYRQYRAIENRLNETYKSRETSWKPLNNLFSTFSEAENTFRLYTLDFNEDVYHAYVEKLDTVKHYIDSITALPIAAEALNDQLLKMDDREIIAIEFALLKKKMDDLMFHTNDSLKLLLDAVPMRRVARAPTALDSVPLIKSASTTSKVIADTIIREKQGLLKRIFNTKDDTIIIHRQDNANIPQQQVPATNPNALSGRSGTGSTNADNIGMMRNTFAELRQKERQLVATNLELLNGLKESMETIRLLEITSLRKAEEQDFAAYRENAGLFGLQLIFALSLMFVMLMALIYYHAYASSSERTLLQEKDYAAKLAEEKTTILAGISHEVRTPLHSLLGIVDLLKNRIKLEKADEKLVDSIYYSINNINSTISDILNLSKLEATSKGEIVLGFFSPVQTFLNVVALHRNQAELKKLALEVDIEIDPKILILSNEFRVKQIVSNLLSNAIKYSHTGTITFRASIEAIDGSQLLHVEVQDSGIGIAEENKHHVFRKYYTVNAKSNVGGVGLGLYISKIMAEELGGKITFRSKHGVGSIFFADIPFTETSIAAIENKEAQLTDLPNHLRVLIVDDNPINILYMKQFFRNFSSIHTVNDGEAALLALEQQPFDIVITDINMPGMRGEQLLQHIRTHKDHQHIKVLAISADMGTVDRTVEETEQIAFDGYIEKPFTEAEMIKALMKALNLDSAQASIRS